ncbi:MAG TPA: DUF3795 domain-containing protein [Bacteroidales bacterium]|nr:DUF3795 domain-containing protein [Bacteroidales bacterium]
MIKKVVLSKCGFRCDLCPAYKENISSEKDTLLLSEQWHRLFGFNIPPEHITCAGCNIEAPHADPNCPVRPCVIDRHIQNCAYCSDFGCDNLKTRMDFLEDYLTKEGKTLSDADYNKYLLAYESKKRLLTIRQGLK